MVIRKSTLDIASFLQHMRVQLKKAAEDKYRQQIERLVPNIRTIGVRVPALRHLAKEFAQNHKDLPFQTACAIMDASCKSGIRDEILFSIFLLDRFQKDLATLIWEDLGLWLAAVDNWEVCDQMALAFVPVVLKTSQDKLRHLRRLAKDKNLWRRRFAAVAAATFNQKGRTDWPLAEDICRDLSNDKEVMVQKAVAWALRECSTANAPAVYAFLAANKNRMAPRLVREASEKLSTQQQKKLTE